MGNLIKEFKRRKVFNVASVYAVVAWVIIQVADTVFPALAMPQWSITFVVIVLLIGFPIALILAWVFQFTAEGIQADSGDLATPADIASADRKLIFTTFGLVLLVVSFLIFDRLVLEPATQSAVTASNLTTDGSFDELVKSQAAIAVMPFQDLSPNQDQSWLASGMTESLVDSLNRIDGIRVAGTASAGILQEQGADLTTIGEELDVGGVVYASVQRSGDDVRVQARWLRVVDESTLWTGRYDRSLEDIFAVQSDITAGIAEAIRQELGIDQPLFRSMESSRYQIDDARLWELLRRSYDLQVSSLRDRDGFRDAAELCQQAVNIDKYFAPGYGCLATISLIGGETGESNEAATIAYAKQALDIDPLNVEAQMAIAWAEWFSFRLNTAEERLRRMISVEPANGFLRARYAYYLQGLGRFDDAVEQARYSVLLEPLLAFTHADLARALLMAGNDTEGLEHIETAMTLNQPSGNNWAVLSIAYERAGREEEALEAALKTFPNTITEERMQEIEEIFWRGFEEGGIRNAWREFALEQKKLGRCSETFFSNAHEKELMFECLELERNRERLLSSPWRLKASLTFSPFRQDERFQELIDELNQRVLEAEEDGPIVPLPQVD